MFPFIKNPVHRKIILLVSISLALMFVFFRNMGAYPAAAGDEFIHYSLASRPINTIADIPGYFFYDIFSFTNSCGSAFYACAKYFNWLFLGCSALVIYFLGRSTGLSSKASTFLVICSVLTQQSIYASFFSPDALFALCFYVFTLFLLTNFIKKEWTIGSCLILGALIALSSLVKPSGVFFLGIFYMYAFTIRLFKLEGSSYKKSGIASLIVTLTFLLTRNLYIYLSIRHIDLSLFGSSYAQSSPGISLKVIEQISSGIATVFINHISWINLVYGLPILGMFWVLFSTRSTSKTLKSLAVFCLCSILFYAVMVAGFTSAVAYQIGGSEVLARFHTRYYYFIYPLILLFLLQFRAYILTMQFNLDFGRKIFFYAYITFFSILMIFAYKTFPASIYINLIDDPDVHGFFWAKNLIALLFVFSFLSVVFFVKNKVFSFNSYLLFYSLFTVSFCYISTRDLFSMTILQSSWGNYAYCGKVLKDVTSVSSDYNNSQLWVWGTGVPEAYHLSMQSQRSVNEWIEKAGNTNAIKEKIATYNGSALLVNIQPMDDELLDGNVLFKNDKCAILFIKHVK